MTDNLKLPRARSIRVTPLDAEGNPVGESLTGFANGLTFETRLPPLALENVPIAPGRLSIEFTTSTAVGEAIRLAAELEQQRVACLRAHGDHESIYGPDAEGVLHWRCVHCWTDTCLPGDCPTSRVSDDLGEDDG